MGNDGGSIPDRRDLVRNKPKAEQADKANQTKAIWFFCALSKKRLQEPVVSCILGKLYNKDALLEYLLDKSAYGDGERICGHIRGLKDVKLLKLTPNPAPASSSTDELDQVSFICPLTMKEMNGVQPFVYISTCGCVFSQAGLKTVMASGSPKEKETPLVNGDEKEKEKIPESLNLCPQCGTKYSKDDVIQLNPPPEEQLKMQFLMERKRALEPSKKKTKKRKNNEDEVEQPPHKKPTATQSKSVSPVPGSGSAASRPSVNPTVAGASRAVVKEIEKEEEKRKANMSAAVKSLYGDGKQKKSETFMTRGTFTRYA